MRRIIYGAVILAIAVTSAKASQIELKKNFFTGWKYSVDGVEYRKVGYSGDELRAAMAGNEPAQARMDKYKALKTWATVTAVPGGFLIGWPLGGYLATSEWKDSYTTMYIIGVPLSITSIILEASATKNLKRAVRIYNGEETAPSAFLPVPSLFASSDGETRIGLTWRF